MKNKKTLLVYGLLLSINLLCFRPGYGEGTLVDREALLDQAKGKGPVRVIVTFGVPELEKLQQASQAFNFLPPGIKRSQADIAKAKEADRSLAEAIGKEGLSVFEELGLKNNIKHFFKTVPQAVISASYEDLLSLASSPRVMQVVEDKLIPVPVSLPSEAPETDSAPRSYGVNIINAPTAWIKGYDGASWYVAVLDTGVRTSHEMFTGKDIVEACFSTTNADTTSLCPGGAAEAEGPGSAVPPDEYGHGTHVAGIAVGNQPNGDLKGVAPEADLIAIQVFSYVIAWGDVGSWTSDQIKGLEYVYGLRATHSIASANLSLGGGDYDSYCDEDSRKPVIDQLRAAGIAVTVSNGNDGYCGKLGAPACISSAVSVGASDYNDMTYFFNDWHPVMQDIFAPGVSIYSAIALGDTVYSTKTGTSMAAPHVAGAWAIFRQTAPTATVSEIESIMEQTGVAVESSCDTNPKSGPRLDVAAVVDYFLNQEAVPTANAGSDQTVGVGNTVTLDASASVSNSGNGLTYNWVQTEGPGVTLSDPNIVDPTFITPVAALLGGQLVFQLTVTDDFNYLTDTDTVTITCSADGGGGCFLGTSFEK